MKTQTKFLFLDTETTSITPNTGQIIELGAVLTSFDTDSEMPSKTDSGPKNTDSKGEFCSSDTIQSKTQPTTQLKILDTFEVMVSLRGEMDDKITRITGITKEELAVSGKALEKAQDSWNKWFDTFAFSQKKDLESGTKSFLTSQESSFWNDVFGDKDLILVGHSIDFDLDFLENEGWLKKITESFDHDANSKTDTLKIGKIDTLNWAKFFLADQEAINLEALSNTLDLDTKTSKKLNLNKNLNGENSQLGSQISSQIRPHRALYDSFVCLSLFEYLLERINNWQSKIPSSLANVLVEQINHRSKM